MHLSSARITSKGFVLLLLTAAAAANGWPQAAPGAKSATATANSRSTDPAQLFQRGQDSLAQGQLDEAERAFREVLRLDPRSGAAYANLGVVYMRRKQWDRALQTFEKAEALMPRVAGLKLNIGLAYYRENEFLKAIPPFEAVVRDQPEASQPRYLLGLCYFFTERWADAASTLEPLWLQESGHLPYLYVLSNAAHRAGRKNLDERAAAQLLAVGNDSPEYHLFAGKYHLNREEYDLAIGEFEAAAKANPALAFVHFNLGLAHLKKQEYAEARDEFVKDAAVEPDLALDYDELGEVYWLMQDQANAEKSYREAVLRGPRLANPHLGLAKIYQRQKNFAAALAEADASLKLDFGRSDAHYVRGQILLRLGRRVEARKEMTLAASAGSEADKTPTGPVPSPELMQEPQ